jgi:hypothetical protein
MGTLFQIEDGATPGVSDANSNYELPEPILDAEFQEMHAKLRQENPTFVPRTFIVEDLPDELI